MIDLSPEHKYNTRNLLAVRGSAVRIYMRLVGYAWQYKFRLIVSLIFAVCVAFSLGSMIVSIGNVVTLLYIDEASFASATDPIIVRVEKSVGEFQWLTGWEPRAVGENTRAFLTDMRAHRGRALGYLSVLLISIALFGGTARFFQEYFAGTIGASISVQLGREMFENIVRLPISFFEQRTSGEILARFTNDVFMVNRGLANTFVKLFREPIKLVICLSMALFVDWQLTLTVLVVLPAVGYVMVRVGKKVRKSVRRSLEKIASTASVGAETVNGIMVVKAFGMEDYEIGRVREELRKLRHNLLRMARADAIIEPATEFLFVLGFIIFMLLANSAVETGRLQVGGLVILFGSLVALLDPIRKLSSVNNILQTSVASAERVFEFIDAKSDIVEVANPVNLAPLQQTLRFENVHFSYNGKAKVLDGVDFEVKKGEMIALVGFSGAGKSTIVKLIPRFYDVTAGRIAIDGIDIRQATFKSLREQISIVTQDTILFNESIRDNIAFGRPEYSDERVRQAAAAAKAAEFIEKLPQQYKSVIGESGGSLSGGQRQRLAIARAIIKDPAILILDEATSSLDSESEQAIQKAIEQFIVGRTTIVIAHRLSTVRRADRILVIDEGRIAEQGTHDDLLARGGLYRRLYDVQFASMKDAVS